MFQLSGHPIVSTLARYSYSDNWLMFDGDINVYSKVVMITIAEITIGKSFFDLLFSVTTGKPTRIGLRSDRAHEKILLDDKVILALLKLLVVQSYHA